MAEHTEGARTKLLGHLKTYEADGTVYSGIYGCPACGAAVASPKVHDDFCPARASTPTAAVAPSAPPEAREERSGVERRVNTGCSCQRRPKAVACVSEDRLADRRAQPNRGRAARREP